MTETATLRTSFRFARSFLCALILILPVTGKGKPQTAGALSQIKKVYVGSLGDGRAADTVRQRIAERLRASRKVQITQTLEAADATVTGTARIWVTGYISAGVHPSNRQPVEDGFLSADLVGKGGATLWSYLVTPSKFHLKSITNDLADQLVKKLLEALADGTSEAPAVLTSPGREAVSIHGAGATFPWPLYQKWFESFGEKAPNVHIRYDPIGSESGIQRITRGELDFAASDMPLSDQAMERSSARFIHIASVLGAVVPIYNL
ncbi:MAG TPA: substrate-binding domain-containing protein, partial [Blastocatellia bacterium]|nr:substrate-binding domain-containing protein [Blastocatellia bacterium]